MDTVLGKPDRRRESVGSAADDHCGGHVVSFCPLVRVHFRDDPGAAPVDVERDGTVRSQGCSSTASYTSQVPRSTTPRAASITGSAGCPRDRLGFE